MAVEGIHVFAADKLIVAATTIHSVGPIKGRNDLRRRSECFHVVPSREHIDDRTGKVAGSIGSKHIAHSFHCIALKGRVFRRDGRGQTGQIMRANVSAVAIYIGANDCGRVKELSCRVGCH